MQRFLTKTTEFLDIQLDLRSRLFIVAGALLLIPTFLCPLWKFEFESERYPNGLSVMIYSHSIEGGKESDLLEIYALNHYLGMKPIEEEKIVQFLWLPFLLGLCIMLALRVAVLGKMSRLVDLFVLIVYIGSFSLWSFYDSLYSYGHNLNPYATVRIEPFTPSLFGRFEVGHVQVIASPGAGAYFLTLIPLIFLAALWLSKNAWYREHLPSRDYVA